MNGQLNLPRYLDAALIQFIHAFKQAGAAKRPMRFYRAFVNLTAEFVFGHFFNAGDAKGAKDANFIAFASFAPLAPFALKFLFERLIKNYPFAHPRVRARHRD